MDIITPEQAIEAAKGMTFEKYWAMLMEDRKNRDEKWRKYNKKCKNRL